MYVGYHAYGLVDHYLPDAVRLLREMGYGAVTLPLGGRLHPRSMSPGLCNAIIADIEAEYAANSVRLIVDASGPYVLAPTNSKGLQLLGADDDQWRLTREAIEWSLKLAKRLGGHPLVLKSGHTPSGYSSEAALDEIASRLELLLPQLDKLDMEIALQPAEEHFIHSVVGYQRLLQWFDSPRLRLAVDTATMFRQIEFPLFSVLGPVRERLAYVTFRDPAIRAPAGDWIGQGSISCDAVVECLKELAYDGGLLIHSWPADHQALDTAHAALQRMRAAM